MVKVGDDFLFHYLLDDWSTQGISHEEFLCCFTLACDPWNTNRNYWDGRWNQILEGTLWDQRVEDLLCMHRSIIHIKALAWGAGWLGEGGSPPSVQGV